MDSTWSSLIADAAARPHRCCLVWQPGLAVVDLVGAAAILLALIALPVVAAIILKREKALQPLPISILALLTFAIIGLIQLLYAEAIWQGIDTVQDTVILLLAVLSITASVLGWRHLPALLALPSASILALQRDRLLMDLGRKVASERDLLLDRQRIRRQLLRATTTLRSVQVKLKTDDTRLRFTLTAGEAGLWDWKLGKAHGQTGKVEYSPRLLEMLGYSEQESAHFNCAPWAMVHPADRGRAMAAFTAHNEGERPAYTSEHRLLTPRGTAIWIADKGQVVEWDDHGRPLRALGTVVDITRRKTLEQALKASQMRMRRLYDQTPVMLHSVDTEGRIISVTDRWLDMTGYRRDEVIGRRSIDFMTEASRDEVRNTTLPAFRDKGVVHDVPCRMVRKDGAFFDVLLSASAERDQKGRLQRTLTVMTDVTVQNQTRRHLQESEARLQLALEGAREGMWDWNTQTGHLFLSPQAGAILGYPADALPSRIDFWQALLPADDRSRFAQKLKDLVTGEIASLVCEQEILKSDGSAVWLDWRASRVVSGSNGSAARLVGMFHDITAKKRAELATVHRAMHDALTDLPNRMVFEEQLERARGDAEANGRRIAVMFLDLDRFKEVNDTYGHDCGDRLLVEVGRRLQNCVRKSDLIARFGGDEFALLAADYKIFADITGLAQRIINAIAEPMEIDGNRIEIGVSIGITVFPDDPSPAEILLSNADLALYQAKRAGRTTWRRYHPGMPTRRQRPQVDEQVILKALAAGEFELRYLPMVRLLDLAVIGVEADLRWNHPKRGHLTPGDFLPEIATSTAVPALTAWLLRTALEQFKTWGDLGVAETLSLAVNILPHASGKKDLVDLVRHPLMENGIAPDRLWLEFPETALSADMLSAKRLARLHALKVKIAIDDFGLGQASIGRLKTLTVDRLKIDSSFVANMTRDDNEAALAGSIVDMASHLGKDCVALGIETADQLAAIGAIGCAAAQGPLFAPPIIASDMPQWLTMWRERCNHDRGLDLLRRGG